MNKLQKTMGKSNHVVSAAHDSAPTPKFGLLGIDKFVRNNPRSDRFKIRRFHHFEFWCGDATNTACRFTWGLGMPIAAKSDLSTGNSAHASFLLRSGDLSFIFTAPYSPTTAASGGPGSASIPTFDHSAHLNFSAAHGLGVRAIALEVEDAAVAYETSVAHGARPSSPPVDLDSKVMMAEVELYGDVVLRYVSYNNPENAGSWILPRFEPVEQSSSFVMDFGIRVVDHAVGNVPELGPAVSYVEKFTGFHEFVEFTAEELGLSESGFNSVVLANNDETVLLPLFDPVLGTKRKSKIETYLEYNQGAGVQHLALVSEDIFRTLKEMRKRSGVGGFKFMPPPPPTYYDNLKARAGHVLSDEQIGDCRELGIMVDMDDEGTLLQIFTQPLGDRPTLFFEIIQRIGCMLRDEKGKEHQKGGCGGFGKGNISALYKSHEEYEKTLEPKPMHDPHN